MARHSAAPDVDYIRSALKANSDAGVAFYRDGGDKFGVSALAKSIAPEYGIEYRTPVYIIHRKGFYGDLYGVSYESPAEFQSLVLNAKKLGADFIKIAVTGILDFRGNGQIIGESLKEPELTELVKIARGEGFAVMAHVNGSDAVKAACRAGVGSVEHGFWADADSIRCMRDAGTTWVPTCVTVLNNLQNPRFSGETLKKIARDHESAVLYAHSIGVPVASGSDAGAFGVRQGEGAAQENAYLSRIGIDTSRANEDLFNRFR